MVYAKKNYWYLVLAFLLVMILSACGTSPQQTEVVISSPTTAAETSAPLQTADPVSDPTAGTLQETEIVNIPEVVAGSEVETTVVETCEPTAPDMLGPFYKPDAPVRNSVGEGYVLSGTVRSSEGCMPIPDATIEFWLAGPDGAYADEYRATVIADQNGAYRFESHAPPPYSGRPPHIHVRVTAPGYQELVTQHYTQQGQTEAIFDLVLQP